MPVISSDKNTEAMTMTFVAEFAASPERVWQVWEDARKLERWWGPPTYPATFEEHNFAVGGVSRYYMTSPEGEKFWGWWEITAIDAPKSLEFDDGFLDDEGERSTSIDPTHGILTLDPIDGGTRMTILSTFTTVEQLQQMVEMGMQEGMQQAMGQIDALLQSESAAV